MGKETQFPMWEAFSQIHIYSAYTLAMKAAGIEIRYKKGLRERPQELVFDEYFAYVIGSLFASVGFLEALINEVFLLADRHVYMRAKGESPADIIRLLSPRVIESLAKAWNSTPIKFKDYPDLARTLLHIKPGQAQIKHFSGGSALNKFQLALNLSDNAQPFDTNDKGLKAVDLLIRLRNQLTHYKPNFVTVHSSGVSFKVEIVEATELMKELELLQKCSSPLFHGKDAFIPLLGANCAMWGVDSSLQFVAEFSRRMPLELNYRVCELALKRQNAAVLGSGL